MARAISCLLARSFTMNVYRLASIWAVVFSVTTGATITS